VGIVSAPVRLGDHLADAMARVDGCPNACDNTEPPRAAIPINGGWRCSYLCAACGHAWVTDYREDC